MSGGKHRIRLTVKAIAAAKPAKSEYTLWDTLLAHFGVRVQPSGVRAYIVQTRVRGRMRKITLRRFPELSLDAARREGAAVLARLWGGEDVTPPRTKKAPLFRDFAKRYRKLRRHRWKPSSLETYDIYMRNRLMPHFGKLRLDAINHARVSTWFDTASVDKPGAANRAFEILRALLKAARQWGDIGEHVPGACANIARNPSRPVARYLDHSELERLGDVLDRHQEKHPRPVAAIRLLTLTGARLSEVGNLKWRELGEVGDGGARARLENTKTGAPTVWLGPEATSLLASLPRTQDGERVFPGNLTSDRPYTFWVGIRDKASLPGLRIHVALPQQLMPRWGVVFTSQISPQAGQHEHGRPQVFRRWDCRHTWASQGIMNGVGLTRSDDCSGTASVKPRRFTLISTMARYSLRQHRRRPSSPVPWDTGASL